MPRHDQCKWFSNSEACDAAAARIQSLRHGSWTDLEDLLLTFFGAVCRILHVW
jgi:hypothetical protein